MFSRIYKYINFKTLLLAVFYLCVSSVCYWIAYELRFDFNLPDSYAADRLATLWWVVLLQLCLLFAAGQLESILSYFRLPDAMRLFVALLINCVILLSAWYLYGGRDVPPRSVILTFFLLSFLSIAAFRVLMRISSSRSLEDWFTLDASESVIIVGAGEVGASLSSELMSKTRLGMRPVAFVDDDPSKIGRYVHGILVVDSVDQLPKVAQRYSATKVAIAFPSASVGRIRTVAKIARDAGLAVDTVPALTDIVSGRAEMSQLRPIELEDLLGRDPVDLNSTEIEGMIRGKRILVTGAGGSIGSELVSQIAGYAPSEVLCLDQAEIAVFELQQTTLAQVDMEHTQIQSCVADVLNDDRMHQLFSEFQPDIVFHAAAHKHVNLMESQPGEALRNNFLATANLVRIASDYNVDRFILISTDKAINPTSVMGASKRLAELAVTSQQNAPNNTTKFMAVRFGNVLGSSGSVIPIFRRQISTGGPITVTDPEVTRFFMTVEEAVGLVLQSSTQGRGGEIFVLDMGESIKIVDVARQMIALSGLIEGRDIEIRFTGLRPGEKLFEEVQHLSEELTATRHQRIMRFVSKDTSDINAAIAELKDCLRTAEPDQLKAYIKRYVPEYSPSN